MKPFTIAHEARVISAAMGLVLCDLVLSSFRLRHPVPLHEWPVSDVALMWFILAIASIALTWLCRVPRRTLGGITVMTAMAIPTTMWDFSNTGGFDLLVPWAASLGLGCLGAVVARKGAVAAVFPLIWIACAASHIPTASPPTVASCQDDTVLGEHCDQPDILLVTIDTLREDALSSSPRALIANLTPTLEDLASEGCQVNGATAPAPLTGPSHAAMLSGQHPIDMGLIRNGQPLPASIPWLPETLRQSGYRTAAFVSSALLDTDLGYGRGFDVYDDDQSGKALVDGSSLSELFPSIRASRAQRFSRPGVLTIDRMTEWLEDQPEADPVFIWLHLYDAHRPYNPTWEALEFVSQESVELPPPDAYQNHPSTAPDREPPPTPNPVGISLFRDLLPPGEISAVLKEPGKLPLRYLAGVRDVDELIDSAWSRMEEHRSGPPGVWSVLSDHGESLTEHGELGSHQHNVYEANLRVPWLISPGPCPGGAVSTHGLAGALLERAGLSVEPFPTLGDPLPIEARVVSVMRQDDSVHRLPKYARRSGQWKIVLSESNAESELLEVYNLETDPHELEPLSEAPADLGAMLELARERSALPQGEQTLHPDVLPALRSLGYIDG